MTLTSTELCFLRGTHILTPTGETLIEDLRIGDPVVTRFGGIQTVKWIGRQTYDAGFMRNNPDKLPVRIRAGALGEQSPARDLYVSPAHSVLVDGHLILAELLVNGATITRDHGIPADDLAFVEYFNIELETHDCVIAEGAWAETFADGPGLREEFHNAAEFYRLYPGHQPSEDINLCAQRPERGPRLRAALRPIVARAAAGAAQGRLQGFIDCVRGDWQIAGWAFDADYPEMPVLLEIFLRDNLIGSVLACDKRADLLKAGKGRGRCAFTFMSPERLTHENLATLRIRRAGDGAEIKMTRACRERIEALSPTAAPPRQPEARLRLVA